MGDRQAFCTNCGGANQIGEDWSGFKCAHCGQQVPLKGKGSPPDRAAADAIWGCFWVVVVGFVIVAFMAWVATQ